jgi:UDP-N-acetylglucosamine 1-carboxyvinyltransferase
MPAKIRVVGGNQLKGSVKISGAKNAALPLMAASLLTSDPLELTNMPNLADVVSMGELLAQHGITVKSDPKNNKWKLRADDITSTVAPYELVSKLRASFLVLGPLLTRCRKARVSLPGGDAIGTRPVDIHLNGFKQMGADIELNQGYINASAPHGLFGATINMPFPSVNATENLMMAATLATGDTHIINAAREPEIIDLANCLNAMGAKIEGAGTDRITIEGVEDLGGAKHKVVSDRIEAGTYIIAALITQGEVFLENINFDLLPSFISALQSAGGVLEEQNGGIWVRPGQQDLVGVDVMTEPFPGFATDLQAQYMALMTRCQGASMITETIFENRFMHVPELCRMGANITVHGRSALVRGVDKLSGAQVMATDLRASVCLILAGLIAKGETILSRVYHLDRGYEDLEGKLASCGAQIERID